MSLINDALRRAQTDVDAGRIKPVPVGLSGAPSRSSNKGSFLVIITLVLVVGIAAWGIALFIGGPGSEKESVAPALASVESETEFAPVESEAEVLSVEMDATVAQSTPITSAASAVEVQPEVEASEQIAETTPVAVEVPVAVEASVEEVESLDADSEVVQVAVVETSALEPEVSETVESLTLKDEIIFTLKQLDITAVMGDGKNARLMMGEQIYKAGELINLDLKIRFYGKKGTVLYFTDEHGQLYDQNI